MRSLGERWVQWHGAEGASPLRLVRLAVSLGGAGKQDSVLGSTGRLLIGALVAPVIRVGQICAAAETGISITKLLMGFGELIQASERTMRHAFSSAVRCHTCPLL